MQDFILTFMNQFGYLGIMLLIIIENIFPPIPSEVILSVGGFMTTYTTMTVPMVIISSSVGSVIGAIILYYIGRLLNKERLTRVVRSKTGKALHLKETDIESANDWFEKKGSNAVFYCRFVPIVRSLISIPAGMSNMPFGRFLILTTLGTIIWNTVLVCLGYKMGENWSVITDFTSKYKEITWLAIILLVGLIIWRKHQKKKLARS